jgi:hypothetical protein
VKFLFLKNEKKSDFEGALVRSEGKKRIFFLPNSYMCSQDD